MSILFLPSLPFRAWDVFIENSRALQQVFKLNIAVVRWEDDTATGIAMIPGAMSTGVNMQSIGVGEIALSHFNLTSS